MSRSANYVKCARPLIWGTKCADDGSGRSNGQVVEAGNVVIPMASGYTSVNDGQVKWADTRVQG